MKKTPIQQLIAEMQKSPMMFAPALLLIENNEYLQKEKQFLGDVYQAGYDSKGCNNNEQAKLWNEYLKA